MAMSNMYCVILSLKPWGLFPTGLVNSPSIMCDILESSEGCLFNSVSLLDLVPGRRSSGKDAGWY